MPPRIEETHWMNMRDHRLLVSASKRRRANAVSILVSVLVLQIAGAPYGFAQAAPPAERPPQRALRLALGSDEGAARAAPILAVPGRDAGDARERSRTFWMGAGLIVGAAAVAGGGVLWLRQNNKPACDAPLGAVCEQLYDTTLVGWLTIAAAIEMALGGTMLMILYRDRGNSVAMTPTGISGTF
jgi:hypothetical protein